MVADAMREIENNAGRDARDVEVAEVLGMSLEEYHQILQDSTGCRIFSLDELNAVGEGLPDLGEKMTDGPYEGLQKDAFKQALADAIAGLPERERLVVAMYYDDEMNLREIGHVLGVSESRVCQIHSQATLRLRSRLSEWLALVQEDNY
jgi:RNA polymerase sigma factor for flagellar operon FliA